MFDCVHSIEREQTVVWHADQGKQSILVRKILSVRSQTSQVILDLMLFKLPRHEIFTETFIHMTVFH